MPSTSNEDPTLAAFVAVVGLVCIAIGGVWSIMLILSAVGAFLDPYMVAATRAAYHWLIGLPTFAQPVVFLVAGYVLLEAGFSWENRRPFFLAREVLLFAKALWVARWGGGGGEA